MEKVFAFLIFIYWSYSALYVMNWHRKNGNLYYSTGFVAILMGPVLFIFLQVHEREAKKHEEELEEIERTERQRRWFQTMGLINRNSTPNYWRSIPPPPPISRIERLQFERDEAIRTARERINKNKKDFKFFQK